MQSYRNTQGEPPVKTGLEVFARSPMDLTGKRLGLLCNPASVDSRLQHARSLIDNALPGQLKALVSPQHGFFAEKQDNMIESADRVDPRLKLPIFSLYGESRRPRKEMMEMIDVLLIDLQDVGTRVYTFMYTVAYCLEAARKHNKLVVILDRPNPINGETIEGNVLNSVFSSFVGLFPIPMRHGLTMGELALLFNTQFKIGCRLEVVTMHGWKRRMYFEDTGLPWVAPSPNMPTPVTAMVYPGQVLWEGTNVSEGRGTSQPFELWGAPYLDTTRILDELADDGLLGVCLREIEFEPTANKWKDEPCRGFQLHVTDREIYRPYETSLALLQTVIRHHSDAFQWKQPPYEYEYEKNPIDLLIGDREIRRQLETGVPIKRIRNNWENGLNAYGEMIQQFQLYS